LGSTLEPRCLAPRFRLWVPPGTWVPRDLADAHPTVKRMLVRACAACIRHDRKVTLEEAELLRAVTAALDCPMPPFVPGMEI